MLAHYYQYNHTDPLIESFIAGMNECNYRYYASELLQRILHSSGFDLESSVRKAVAVMRLTGIPVQNHFFRIYRSGISGLKQDWKLSELACSLIILSYESPNADLEAFREAIRDHLGI